MYTAGSSCVSEDSEKRNETARPDACMTTTTTTIIHHQSAHTHITAAALSQPCPRARKGGGVRVLCTERGQAA